MFQEPSRIIVHNAEHTEIFFGTLKEFQKENGLAEVAMLTIVYVDIAKGIMGLV